MAKIGNFIKPRPSAVKFKITQPVRPSLQETILTTLLAHSLTRRIGGQSPTVEKIIDTMPEGTFKREEIINGIKDLANKEKVYLGKKPKNNKAKDGSDFLMRRLRIAEPGESSKKSTKS